MKKDTKKINKKSNSSKIETKNTKVTKKSSGMSVKDEKIWYNIQLLGGL